MRMKYCLILLMICTWSLEVSAKWGVGAGAHVPFGLSTQKDKEGGTSALNFQPSVFASGLFPAPLGHLYMPELGFIFYTGLENDYSKRTTYILMDVGYKFSANFLLRYGFGIFATRISADGKALTLPNGSSTSTFYQPSEAVTTYNVTWNLGIESALSSNWSARFEVYLYEILSSVKRDFSYTLNATYYF